MNYKLKKDLLNLKAGAIFKPNNYGGYDGPDGHQYFTGTVENNPEWFEPYYDIITLPIEQYESAIKSLRELAEKSAERMAALEKEKQNLEDELNTARLYHNEYVSQTKKLSSELNSKITTLEAKAEYWLNVASKRSNHVKELEHDLSCLRNTPDNVTIGFPYNSSELASNCKVEVPSGYVLIQDGKHVKWSDEDMLNFAGHITSDKNYLQSILKNYATNKQHRH